MLVENGLLPRKCGDVVIDCVNIITYILKGNWRIGVKLEMKIDPVEFIKTMSLDQIVNELDSRGELAISAIFRKIKILSHATVTELTDELSGRDNGFDFFDDIDTSRLVDIVESRGQHVYNDNDEFFRELDDDDLTEEMDYRGYSCIEKHRMIDPDIINSIENLHTSLSLNNKEESDRLLKEVIYNSIGRIL